MRRKRMPNYEDLLGRSVLVAKLDIAMYALGEMELYRKHFNLDIPELKEKLEKASEELKDIFKILKEMEE